MISFSPWKRGAWWNRQATAPRSEAVAKGGPGKDTILRIALILACAIATVLPYFWRGPTCGHDFDFHLQSWLAAARQWHHGVVYPNWIEGANFGAGEPRFVFYPPISWMLGALAGTILPWTAAPAAFTLVVMIGYGLAMYALARDWMPPNTATLAACAYILSPYALFVAYERTAYGELAAGIWLPMIVRYALRPGRVGPRTAPGPGHASVPGINSEVLERRSTTTLTNILGLSIAVAAIWLSNAPAAVMSCYFLAAIALWISIARGRLQPVLQAAAGLTLGLSLAAFYIVPAAWERRWVDIAHALAPGVRYQEGFLFSHSGVLFHDAVLRKISWIFVTLLVTTALAAVVAWKRGTSRRILLPLLAAATVLFALQLPCSGPIWQHTPELKFLQFPWRWTLVLSLVFAMTIGFAAAPRQTPNGPRRVWRNLALHAAMVLLVAAAIMPRAAKLFWQYCDDEDAVSAQVELFQSDAGYQGTDEYAPLGSDNSIVQQALPPVRVLKTFDAETVASPATDDQANPAYSPDPGDQMPSRILIQQWQPEHRSVSILDDSPGFAVLRVMDYPALQILVDGVKLTDRPHRADGLLTIPFQPGATRIDIRYAATPDVWMGRALSIAALLILAAFAVSEYRRRPSTKVPYSSRPSA